MPLIGYARVSTTDQSLTRQLDELERHGLRARLRRNRVREARRPRPQWEACLDHLRPGDTLVVTELARLVRNTGDLGYLLDHLDEH